MLDDIPAGMRRLSRRLLRNLSSSLPMQQSSAGRPALDPSKWARRSTPASGADSEAVEIAAFGANPGALAMRLYVPRETPRPGCALLVLLHGCGQDPDMFARDIGWMRLADELRAPLLLPVQVAGNNPGRCFNWFAPEKRRRDAGEAASVRAMIGYASARFSPDPRRIFVAGLSAGGAMAAALLAAYPEIFAAGAIAAGLPVGAADDVQAAFGAMAGSLPPVPPDVWAARARAAGPAIYHGTWPRLSIWQGAADRTVAPANAESLAQQWATLNGLGDRDMQVQHPQPGVIRRVWGEGAHPALESWTIDGLAHGFPAAAGPVTDRFVLPVGIDATACIARFFDL